MVSAAGLYLSAGRGVVSGFGRRIYHVHDVEGRVEGEEGGAGAGYDRFRRD